MEIERVMNLQSLKGIREGIENGDIPEWLLVEVLLRLSAKLVCRFKLISRQWFSIISDPAFVRAYISRASLLSQPWTFISHLMHHEGFKRLRFPEYTLLDDVYSQVLKPSYCVLPPPCSQQLHGGEDQCVILEQYVILGVSGGLVLYGLSDIVHSYFICNPVTRLWIALPACTCRFSEESFGFLTHVEDGILKSYRVVRLEMLSGRKILLRFEVFFSEIGEWKSFTVSRDLRVPLILRRYATAVNGVLHWVVGEFGIIAYDPYQSSPEHMHVIAFPDDKTERQRQNPYNSLCAEYKGKLRYFELSFVRISGNQFPSFKLWVLNDHISRDWSLQHQISYMDIQYDANLSFKTSIFSPISFDPFNLDIVYLGLDDALVSYNIETKKLEIQQKFYWKNENTRKQRPLWRRFFLFVIPPWPISIPCASFGATNAQTKTKRK